MFTLNNEFGPTRFATSVNDAGDVSSRYMSISTEANLNFVKKLSILKTNIVQNSFGLYSFQQAGRNGKVRFASLTQPKHLFSKRKAGCTFNEKGRIQHDLDEITLCPIEANMKHCPDFALGTCLDKLYGVGNQVRDMFATPEGRTYFGQIVTLTYEGLGNSFYDVIWYGKHPLVAEADVNEWYSVDDNEWDDFVDQQASCGGLMTMIDEFKLDGEINFSVPVNVGDISGDRQSYIGDPTVLFDRVLKAQSPEMKLLSKRASNTGGGKTVLLVSPEIFEAYEDKLTTDWPAIPDSFYYKYNGRFCDKVGCNASDQVEGTLKYKGHLVVCMDEWQAFDVLTGTKTFRCICTIPGNFGVGYDTPTLEQTTGFGLRLTQHLDAPFMGAIYMDTTLEVGTGIIDRKHMVNASLTFTPE